MPKRTLEEIHRFNQKLKEKDLADFNRRWKKNEDRLKPSKKREALHTRYLNYSELHTLNHFKEMLLNQATLESFIEKRCRGRYPSIAFLHTGQKLMDDNIIINHLTKLLTELKNRELCIRYVKFLSQQTKPFIHKAHYDNRELSLSTYDIYHKYGLLVMWYDDFGRLGRFILTAVLNLDHKVSELDFIYDVPIYNYVLCENFKLPAERRKETHYMEGRDYMCTLSNGESFTFNTAFSDMSLGEALTHAEENIVKHRIKLENKPKILVRRCPKCGDYLEKSGTGNNEVHRCHSCGYKEYENINPNEPVMKCPDCKEGDAVFCYKWDKKNKKRIEYIGCTNAPGCTLHIREHRIKESVKKEIN